MLLSVENGLYVDEYPMGRFFYLHPHEIQILLGKKVSKDSYRFKKSINEKFGFKRKGGSNYSGCVFNKFAANIFDESALRNLKYLCSNNSFLKYKKCMPLFIHEF